MRKEFLLVLMLGLAFSTALFAQEERTGYEIGFYAAIQDWKPHSVRIGLPQASTPVDLSFFYNDRPAYGVRGNFLSKRYWGGELSYSYQKNTVNLTRVSFSPVTLRGAVHQAFYNQIFYPVRYVRKVVPFVTGGAGIAIYTLSDDARARAADPRIYGLGNLKSSDNRVAFNYGGGLKVNLIEQFGFRVDFRHNFSDVPSYGLPKESPNPAQLVFPAQGKLQNYEFSVGIFFRKLSEGFK